MLRARASVRAVGSQSVMTIPGQSVQDSACAKCQRPVLIQTLCDLRLYLHIPAFSVHGCRSYPVESRCQGLNRHRSSSIANSEDAATCKALGLDSSEGAAHAPEISLWIAGFGILDERPLCELASSRRQSPPARYSLILHWSSCTLPAC